MDILLILKNTLSGMFPLFAITSSGIFLTYKKVLNEKTNAVMSGCIANFLSPTMSFIYISSSFDLGDIETIFPLLIGPFIGTALAVCIGFLHSKVANIPINMRNTLISVISFPNFGLVYILMAGMCSDYGPFASRTVECQESNGYVSIFMLPMLLLYWTFGFIFTQVDKKYRMDLETDPLMPPTQSMLELSTISFSKRLFLSLTMPNPLACIFGMLFGLIPWYKSVFFNKDSLTYALGSSFLSISSLGISLGQILLGSNLYLMKGKESSLVFFDILSIVFTRFVVVCGANFGLVYLAWILGAFGENKVITYTLFMCLSTPTAIIVMIFSTIHKVARNEVIQLMFWIYLFSVPSIVIWTFLFFVVF